MSVSSSVSLVEQEIGQQWPLYCNRITTMIVWILWIQQKKIPHLSPHVY